MRIRTKIVLLFTLGTTVPFLLGNLFVVWGFSSMFEDRIGEQLSHTATLAARRVGQELERTIEDIESSSMSVPFRELMPGDLERAQEIPYRQMQRSTQVTIVDENGRAVVPLYRPPKELSVSLNRIFPTREDANSMSFHIPIKLSLNASAAIGPVYRGSGGDPRVVIAREVPRRREGDSPWVLAVEISLADLCALSFEYGTNASEVQLVDSEGVIVCTNTRSPGSIPAPMFEQLSSRAVVNWVRPDKTAVLASRADVPGSTWSLVIEESREALRRPILDTYKLTAIWLVVSLAIAIIGGLVLSREFTVPIAALEKAAQQLAKGDYDTNIELHSADELGRLADAFNRMAKEIRNWNEELVRRVEQRTAALREASEQVLRTQKLAAIGELGSGAAHEINNPLTAVIGMSQLLESEVPPDSELSKGLSVITVNARRVADVVDTLLRVSQSQVPKEMHPVDMSQIVRRVVDMHAQRFQQHSIEVEIDVEPPSLCRVHGVGSDLELALSHLVDNAVRALPSGGVIGLSVATVEGGAVQVIVSDNGPGMTDEVRLRAFDPFFTTNAPNSGTPGLGLSLVQRIVEEHAGRIVLESEQGRGTRIKIYLPGAARLSRA